MSATHIQQIVQFIVYRAKIQASDGKMFAHGRPRILFDLHATENWRRSTFVTYWSTSPVTCDDEGAVASISVCRSPSTNVLGFPRDAAVGRAYGSAGISWFTTVDSGTTGQNDGRQYRTGPRKVV